MDQSLEPYAIAYLVLIRILYPGVKDNPSEHPHSFLLIQYLVESIYQVQPPPLSYGHLVDEIKSRFSESSSDGTKSAEEQTALKDYLDSLLALLLQTLEIIVGQRPETDTIKDFMTYLPECKTLVSESGSSPEVDECPLDRKSPFGLFIRRIFINYNRLPYNAILRFLKSLSLWLTPTGNSTPDTAGSPTDVDMDLTSMASPRAAAPFNLQDLSAIMPTGISRPDIIKGGPMTPRYEAFASLQAATQAGDHIIAHDSLRTFMDYRLGSPVEGPLHQHALLNLAALHLDEGGYIESRAALAEAVRTSRHMNDKECLAACVSLERRLSLYDPLPSVTASDDLPRAAESKADGTSSVPSVPTPSDELWKARESLHKGEPVTHAFAHLYRAYSALKQRETIGASSAADEPLTRGFMSMDMSSWHALAAEFWRLLGSDALCSLHQHLALSISTQGEARIQVLASRAAQTARSGRYDEAFALLWSESSIATGESNVMSVKDVQLWQRAIYSVWRARCETGDYPALSDFVTNVCPPRPNASRYVPPVPGEQPPPKPTDLLGPKPTSLDGSEEQIMFIVKKAIKLKDAELPDLALMETLKALSISSFSNPGSGKDFVNIHLLCTILLAEIEIDFGAPNKGLAELERIWAPISSARNPMLSSYARHVKGKCLMASAKDDAVQYNAAIPFLQEAALGYERLGDKQRQATVMSDLAVVYHEINETYLRDQTAEHWRQLTGSLTQFHAKNEKDYLEEAAEMGHWMCRAIVDVEDFLPASPPR